MAQLVIEWLINLYSISLDCFKQFFYWSKQNNWIPFLINHKENCLGKFWIIWGWTKYNLLEWETTTIWLASSVCRAKENVTQEVIGSNPTLVHLFFVQPQLSEKVVEYLRSMFYSIWRWVHCVKPIWLPLTSGSYSTRTVSEIKHSNFRKH